MTNRKRNATVIPQLRRLDDLQGRLRKYWDESLLKLLEDMCDEAASGHADDQPSTAPIDPDDCC